MEPFVRTYGWRAQIAKGEEGLRAVVALLRARGRVVMDVSDIPDCQKRDIDLIVDGRMAEVKTDSYKPVNLFVELTCAGKPGAVFKSRADEWFYFFPASGKLVWVDLARLQHHIAVHGHEYETRAVRSQREGDGGGRPWEAIGLLVPIADIEKHDIGRVMA